jgi:hypothetical protein
MLRYLFRKWSSLEFVAAIATVLSLALSAVPAFALDPRRPIRTILMSVAAASLIWLVMLASRQSFVIVGYSNVMGFLELLASHARLRVWTARTHTGRGVDETAYFAAIAERLASSQTPLDDFRRLLRLSEAAREHIDHLIAEFLHRDAAEVRYFRGSGPQFDFMIADDVAVIGFPMAGGAGNVAAVVLRHTAVVEAVANVFNQLWNDSETVLLFRGSSAFPEHLREKMLTILDREMEQITGKNAHGVFK